MWEIQWPASVLVGADLSAGGKRAIWRRHLSPLCLSDNRGYIQALMEIDFSHGLLSSSTLDGKFQMSRVESSF